MNSFFDEERFRDKLAKKKKYSEFRKSYINPNNIIDKNTKNFWNSFTTIYKETLLNSSVYLDKINRIVRFLVNKTGNILDIGFGIGEIEKRLQTSKLKIHGIDISSVAVKNAKKELKGTYKIGSIFKIPYTTKSMDFVLALDVLEHIPVNKTFNVYKGISRILKTKGMLIISVPINENLEELYIENNNPNNHLRVYTPDIIKTELILNGFKIVKTNYLYAFGKFYFLKSVFINFFKLNIRKPNLMIIFCQKQ
ncbi:MAG: Methylase involved in ubiquinone/menaquinone biosynthesis [Candidatus Woesebacteria bacterium GW2011_GWA1_33_30]|uniref:Methylase involved in ubiquinone/menaquinone biosynthesis n=1 Tax=Candidatus Woesebacteria bacterium GW2011_GWA2_33_28 TaxID=1618561 RepID=A0A0G0A643_9BACT|nr:MAG: Methylase involved in ubiquinone/menaquinone biosynthesis [Candidatus Woesebacteria bacterium GW2011_GWA2_33_28]KKP47573.1 MAG: Methylase involved in ubiquinone/menaquinone biosynthesis [Candidatus Woesebacteria bacterium GW2011_GWA1_33_30]KKP49194.1 MAG: hypothetical protein UR40_C0009G0017 [Microgenomates group bacterium GW2011_GWC1_33_32]KKP51686.1 MAG: Methylase involved in ubiquinone/menaquinone biosynthesis [Candidatus Woesebacteria bacterium GW2011_GWB1_33_38]KKP58467.1 MAG: Meth